ncbi:unnamed protein product [Gordionus sp. m RMFG-2023]|uniref:selenocysteine lyase-like isoform X2 n=1 Tax=Gordionus sp. m RMFG-2023 TaxID=3053472 RepID=UPI0030E50E6E
MEFLYFDYNATTPLEESVHKVISHHLKHSWANPKARAHLAKLIDCNDQSNIIFTSGGTESNNTIVYSVLKNFQKTKDKIYKAQAGVESNHLNSPNGFNEVYCANGNHNTQIFNENMNIPHVITSCIEHDSILLLLQDLQNKGKLSVTYLPISPISGKILISDLVSALQHNTRLITIMLANNETGVIQPIKELSQTLNDFCHNPNSQCSINRSDIIIHTDASQAIGKIPISIIELGVDSLTLTGHKFYGPRIGALYYSSHLKFHNNLNPLLLGGGQEGGLRAGTENTALIAGLGEAARLAYMSNQALNPTGKDFSYSLETITAYLIKRLFNTFGPVINFNNLQFLSTDFDYSKEKENNFIDFEQLYLDNHRGHLLPNTLSVSFESDSVKHEWGCMILEKCSKLMASTGAACHAGKYEPSKVLLNSGMNVSTAKKSIRLSTGRFTTQQQVDDAIEDLRLALNF